MREDPWEFEHFQVRANRHERGWLTDWLERHPDEQPPTKRVICPQCDGKGASSLHLGAFTGDDLADDPDFADDYMAGRYDRQCDTCHGQNVIEILDDTRMAAAMRDDYLEWMSDAYVDDQIARSEYRMGA